MVSAWPLLGVPVKLAEAPLPKVSVPRVPPLLVVSVSPPLLPAMVMGALTAMER